MIPAALLLLIAAPVVMWLFPEKTGNNKHYEGDFGKTDQTMKSLGELTDAESNKIGAWFGYCQGDEDK
jgi:hypothetical protein